MSPNDSSPKRHQSWQFDRQNPGCCATQLMLAGWISCPYALGRCFILTGGSFCLIFCAEGRAASRHRPHSWWYQQFVFMGFPWFLPVHLFIFVQVARS
uniref:Uncharacterized protein n=1 Tax=Knipowitschia caucasica TaxID=637954 RepID=A0AAV2JQU9_KNICA